MLIELLSLLIFLAIAFAFLAKEESERTNPWKEKHDRVAAQLLSAQKTIRRLTQDVVEAKARIKLLEEANRLLRASINGPLAANDRRVMLSAEQLASLNARLVNAEALLQERQVENGRLRERLAGRGGTDLPRCAISPGYLLRIEVTGADVYRVRANWPATAAPDVRRVNGAVELGQAGSVSRRGFESLAAKVSAWGRVQAVPCGFTVLVTESHGDLSLYKSQQRTIGKYFYPAYR